MRVKGGGGVHLKIFFSSSRLERNQEREQGVSNLEYLKNIVLKVPPTPIIQSSLVANTLLCIFQFLHTQGPERSGLIPIVTRLLQLSPQEIKYLQETVKGQSVVTLQRCVVAIVM